MTKDDFAKLLDEVGLVGYGEEEGTYCIPTLVFHDRVYRLANACEKIGMEKAAMICKELESELGIEIGSAEAIRTNNEYASGAIGGVIYKKTWKAVLP